MDEKSAVASLGALAQGMRLRVFRALVGAGPEGMTPGTLAATLGVPVGTVKSRASRARAELVARVRALGGEARAGAAEP